MALAMKDVTFLKALYTFLRTARSGKSKSCRASCGVRGDWRSILSRLCMRKMSPTVLKCLKMKMYAGFVLSELRTAEFPDLVASCCRRPPNMGRAVGLSVFSSKIFTTWAYRVRFSPQKGQFLVERRRPSFAISRCHRAGMSWAGRWAYKASGH